jgi:hypothetical protein
VQHFFILGNPRSGTSLLRIILNSHPNIVAPPECGFSHWWLQKYQDWDINDLHTKRKTEFLNDVLGSKKMETWRLNNDRLSKLVEQRKPSNYSELIDCVYLCYKTNESVISAIIDKNNYYVNHLGDLPKIWPNAKYIFIIRDGRDVACSYLEVNELKSDSKYKPKLPTEISTIAEEWSANNQNILSFLRQNNKKYIMVRFEDLISDTKDKMMQICQFLNIQYHENMLNYFNNSSLIMKEPLETLDWKKKTLEMPDASKNGRYKNDLSQTQIETFNRIANENLNIFGYDY